MTESSITKRFACDRVEQSELLGKYLNRIAVLIRYPPGGPGGLVLKRRGHVVALDARGGRLFRIRAEIARAGEDGRDSVLASMRSVFEEACARSRHWYAAAYDEAHEAARAEER